MRYQKEKFILIAGPCVIENRRHTLEIAKRLKDITAAYPVQFVFKASFDKANRTALSSYRGPGLTKGLEILEEVRTKVGVSILSDVHETRQIDLVKDVLDVIQIPAFLSRQTDLLLAAAQTKKIINIKKSQMMAPGDLKYVTEKVASRGNKKIFLTERGTSFGYNNLVVDFRSLLVMKTFGYPVIFDATHSLQRPSGSSGMTGGDRQFIEQFAFAGVACGIDGLFLEVHPRPDRALSDSTTSCPLSKVDGILNTTFKLRKVLHEKK
ncbi:MAG: 3-deoxy-8-phosphooctulonate synthase [Candidatus Omnitrophica bacterium]|nr:3-deoxy-8-phosphooctulonate synthase [Candidatus Omnitrophota bacterium]